MLLPSTLPRWSAIAILAAACAVAAGWVAASETVAAPVPAPASGSAPASGPAAAAAGAGHAPRAASAWTELRPAFELPAFGGDRVTVYLIGDVLASGERLYARVEGDFRAEPPEFAFGSLAQALERGAAHARMVALAFGTLMGLPLSMVAAAVLIALGVADRLRAQRRALSEAERHARTDALTGVLNRRSLLEQLDAACRRARARGLPLAILFIDLDHFKQINDSFGHPAGDACLGAIVGPIQAELRQSDVIGRYGGEEFVVVLNDADEAAAHPIAERIRQRVATLRVEGFGEPIQLTCSIGVAASDTLGVWGDQLIKHADVAVYGAKRAGRNRVEIAPPPLAA